MQSAQFRWKRMAGFGLTVSPLGGLLLSLAGFDGTIGAVEPKLTHKQTENGLVILSGDQPVATYYTSTEKIARPFYAHVFTIDGVSVTRTFPTKDSEPADHADMHPGIWLAFGDLNGHDFWRNKSRVKTGKPLTVPKETADGFSFTVHNDYIARLKEGEKLIARETCHHTWSQQERGVLLCLDSEFESADTKEPLVFGDQEEMGLGVRIASPLRVKVAGGEIRTSEGKRNEKEAWGQPARWCDYSGKVNGRQVGITLMPHPGNFRKSWFHVRDYGLMVANPFGQNAFTRGERSRLEVKPGEQLRLRYGVWIYSVKETSDKELESSYQAYVKRAGN